MGDTSTSKSLISKAIFHYEVAYLKGCLEVDRAWVNSLWIDIRVPRGRLVALSILAVISKMLVHRGGALKPKVNNEDEQLDLMCDLMENLAKSARLVSDLQGTNDEMQAEHLELQGQIRDLELGRF